MLYINITSHNISKYKITNQIYTLLWAINTIKHNERERGRERERERERVYLDRDMK